MGEKREKVAGLLEFHYPRYEELPQGLVFLSAIVNEVNTSHAPLLALMHKHKKPFTMSMASNYLKQGLTPPPIGRRYTREHSCRIFFAATMKLAFNADDVLALAKRLFGSNNPAVVTNALSYELEQSLHRFVIEKPGEGGGKSLIQPPEGLSPETCNLIWYLADSFAAKACALAIIDNTGLKV